MFTIPSRIGYFATGAATLVLLAGCVGGNGIATPSTGAADSTQSVLRGAIVSSDANQVPKNAYLVVRPGVAVIRGTFQKPFINAARLANAATTIAVSDVINDVVNVYDAGGTQLASLGGFNNPQGLASDIKGNLYVADTADNQVQVFAAGFKGSPRLLPDPGQYPAGVDSFSNGKYIAVTNIISSGDGPGSVSIYKNGVLTATVSDPSIARAYFCAFDATGNLFFDAQDANGNTILGEIVKATSGGTRFTPLTYKNVTFTFPGSVQVTTNGQIAVLDQGGTLYTFNPPTGGSLGSPVVTTILTGSGDAVGFAFTNDLSSLYTADAHVEAVLQFAYPAGGTAESTISLTGGEPVGVAVIPSQFPKVSK